MVASEKSDYLLISGASSGIGRCLAIELSSKYRVILGGRDMDRLQQACDACSRPDQHLIWCFDLADVDNIAGNLGTFLTSHNAGISGFVHSAAMLEILPLRRLTPAMAADAFRINVFSAMEIIRTLTRKQINQQRLGSVVFISSIASKFGAKGFSIYAACKGALDSMMKSLAVELAPQVRLNSVLPGALQTPMTDSIFADPQLAASFEHTYPLGVGQPKDVVDAVEFLLSEKARWITGQQFIIDGGRTTNITA